MPCSWCRHLPRGRDKTDVVCAAQCWQLAVAGEVVVHYGAESDPELLDDILFGAAACLTVEGWAGEHMLTAWSEERTSLLGPVAG